MTDMSYSKVHSINRWTGVTQDELALKYAQAGRLFATEAEARAFAEGQE